MLLGSAPGARGRFPVDPTHAERGTAVRAARGLRARPFDFMGAHGRPTTAAGGRQQVCAVLPLRSGGWRNWCRGSRCHRCRVNGVWRRLRRLRGPGVKWLRRVLAEGRPQDDTDADQYQDARPPQTVAGHKDEPKNPDPAPQGAERTSVSSTMSVHKSLSLSVKAARFTLVVQGEILLISSYTEIPRKGFPGSLRPAGFL